MSESDRICLMNEQAKQLNGNVPGWAPYLWEAADGANRAIIITGAVAPLLTRGKNKGQPNWRTMDRDTVSRVVLSESERHEYCAAWERETGKCSECVGTGEVSNGWSREHGARYKTCPKCNGTGLREVSP
jgi:hypothetical protein